MELAERIFDAIHERDVVDDEFMNTAFNILGCEMESEQWPFEDMSFDSYDSSFELHNCVNGLKLTIDQQNAFWNLGFDGCWLNFSDGTERHYARNYQEGRLKRKSDSVYVE